MSTPLLRVVSGNPSAEELAVLTAVMAVTGGGETPAPVRHGRWNDPAVLVRRPLVRGPGAWQATFR